MPTLTNYSPGDYILCDVSLHGFAFPDQRYLVLRTYGDDRYMLDGPGGVLVGDFHRGNFHDRGATLHNPRTTGETYTPLDPAANSIEILAENGARRYQNREQHEGDGLATITAWWRQKRDEFDRADYGFKAEVGWRAAQDGANIRELERITGLSRPTIYTWRDKYLAGDIRKEFDVWGDIYPEK